MTIDIGISEENRIAVAEALKKTLADTYAVYMKTHGYHWNVQGPDFRTLHLMFEEQYTEMWQALDELAERIRALGVFAPGSGRELAELTAIEETNDRVPEARQMVVNLLKDQETLIRRAREAMEVADDADDDASEDLLTQRIQIHEKTAWMLRSYLA
ncbi:Dps family protein [Parvularcula sp. IMCC14364]|uniref:Dps family protein n=1 Tax=Parvularcula sp. IMCC14364 TaxID=3067902 RepID=UPI002741AA2F|nr:Dps family protein [Parvularcula sp. IMCC14364]